MVSAGAVANASDVNYPATVEAADASVVDGTTTSTSFVNTLTTTGIRGIAFTAGASGKASVWVRAFVRNTSASQSVQIDLEVRTGTTVGSGTVFRSPTDALAGGGQSDSAGQNLGAVSSALITGLTPGASYNACLAYRANSAGTATVNRRWVMVRYEF